MHFVFPMHRVYQGTATDLALPLRELRKFALGDFFQK